MGRPVETLSGAERPIRVLLIDGCESDRTSLAAALTAGGLAVQAAADGRTGLALARQGDPDLVLQELMLPDEGGVELCAKLRNLPGGSSRPIVALAGPEVHEAFEGPSGFDALVRKPVAPAVLIQKILSLTGPRTESSRVRRLERDLDRLQRLNQELTRAFELRTNALEAVGATLAPGRVPSLSDGLSAGLDACLAECEIPAGAILLLGDDGKLTLTACRGFAAPVGLVGGDGLGLPPALIRRILGGPPVRIPSDETVDGWSPRSLGRKCVVLARIGTVDEAKGILLLGVDQCNEDVPILAHSIGIQLGHSVTLAAAFRSLVESQARAAFLMEHAHDGVIVQDVDGNILQANRRAEQILGRPRAQIEGRHFSEFLDPCLAEQEKRRFAEMLRVGSIVSRGVRAALPSRTVFDVSASRIDLDGKPVVLALLRDMTRETILESELLHAQRMEAVGRLAGGVAHDFNNLMGVVLGYADSLQEELPPDSPLQRDVGQIRRAGERAATLTRQLLAFGRKQVLTPRPVELGGLLVGLQAMLTRVLGEDVALEVRPCPDPLWVEADPAQLEQVLLNLAINARDAMPDGGSLVIASGTTEGPALPGGPTVPLAWVGVSDTGIGMDEATRAHLFEPFFTTKPSGKGTGLGLATSHGIITELGGSFEVESSPGKGSTFRFLLPLRDRTETGPSTPVPRTAAAVRSGERILVVEDDPMLRPLVLRSLARLGFDALAVEGPSQAVETLRRDPGRFDLVLTDVVLPGLSGPLLVRLLRELRPGLPVLYMTGFLDHRAVEDGGPELQASLLSKPFDVHTLAGKLREVLDRRPP